MKRQRSIVGRATVAMLVGVGAAVVASGAVGAGRPVTVIGPVTTGVGTPLPVSSNCKPGAGASSPVGSETRVRLLAAPSGLVAYRIYQPGTTVQFQPSLLRSGLFSGVDFAVQWCNLEPSKGVFDWGPIQQVFNEVRGLKGPGGMPLVVTLSLIPGFESPSWVLGHRRVQTIQSDWSYHQLVTPARYLPLPWNQTYLKLWYGFLQHVAATFGDNSQFRMIAVGGPTSVSDEMSLPNWTGDASAPMDVDPAAGAYGGSDIAMWEAAGYSPQRYIGAWAQTFRAYHRMFPNQYLSLALIDGLPIGVQTETGPGRGPLPGPHPMIGRAGPRRSIGRAVPAISDDVIDGSEITATPLGVIAAGMKLGHDFVLQADGLGPSSGNQEPFGYVEAGCGAIDTGFQTHDPQTEKMDNIAATGRNNAPALIKADLTPGVAAGARFVEVYASTAATGLSHPTSGVYRALQYGKDALSPTHTGPRLAQPCEPLRITAVPVHARPQTPTNVSVTYETALLAGMTFTPRGLPGLALSSFSGRLVVTFNGSPLPVACTPGAPTATTTTCTATLVPAHATNTKPGQALKFKAALEIGYDGTYQPVVTATAVADR